LTLDGEESQMSQRSAEADAVDSSRTRPAPHVGSGDGGLADASDIARVGGVAVDGDRYLDRAKYMACARIRERQGDEMKMKGEKTR